MSASAQLLPTNAVAAPPSRDRSKTFQLGDPDRALLLFHDYRNQYGTGEAKLVLYTFGCQLSVRGHSIGSSDGYVSKLSFGQNISSGLFGIYCGADNGFLAVGDQIGYWTDAGIGYIGFRINKGGSFQYGWMRVRMTGRPENGFALLDYAYADVGEPIRAGQTSSAEQAPDQGSLGWLALGAAGLLAWRKSRSRATS